MQIITNDRLIRRNRTIARYASILGLVVLIGGMVISFSKPELIYLSFGALIIGFVLSQVGIFYTNRWGREPRPDQLLNQALKGLDNKYALYHYTSPVSHLLIGPAGLWILFPRHQRGVITYENNRWRQKSGGMLQMYLRLFAQEGLGRPDVEIGSEAQNLQKFLGTNFSEDIQLPIQAALIFTHDNVEIQIDQDEDIPIPTIYLNKLKALIRKSAKGKPISMDIVEQLQRLFSPTDQEQLELEDG